MIAIRDLEMTKERLLSFAEYGKRQTWDRVDRYERIVVERIEAFHHY